MDGQDASAPHHPYKVRTYPKVGGIDLDIPEVPPGRVGRVGTLLTLICVALFWAWGFVSYYVFSAPPPQPQPRIIQPGLILYSPPPGIFLAEGILVSFVPILIFLIFRYRFVILNRASWVFMLPGGFLYLPEDPLVKSKWFESYSERMLVVLVSFEYTLVLYYAGLFWFTYMAYTDPMAVLSMGTPWFVPVVNVAFLGEAALALLIRVKVSDEIKKIQRPPTNGSVERAG